MGRALHQLEQKRPAEYRKGFQGDLAQCNISMANRWLFEERGKMGGQEVEKKRFSFNDLITKKQFNENRYGEKTKTVDQLKKACKARDD